MRTCTLATVEDGGGEGRLLVLGPLRDLEVADVQPPWRRRRRLMLLPHGDQRPQTTPAVGDRSTATMQPQHTRLYMEEASVASGFEWWPSRTRGPRLDGKGEAPRRSTSRTGSIDRCGAVATCDDL
jgi:hypothetical protein